MISKTDFCTLHAFGFALTLLGDASHSELFMEFVSFKKVVYKMSIHSHAFWPLYISTHLDSFFGSCVLKEPGIECRLSLLIDTRSTSRLIVIWSTLDQHSIISWLICN